MSFLDQALNLLPLASVTPLTDEERNIATIPAGPLAAAVADLTAEMTPAYAGFTDSNHVATDDEKFFVGSLAKIMPMYAAHELRFRVQQVVTSLQRDNLAATPQKIFHAIGKAWGPQVNSKIGIGVPSPTTGLVGIHDCAIVTRTEAGRQLRYVAVVLGGFRTGADADAWDETARALDASVLASH